MTLLDRLNSERALHERLMKAAAQQRQWTVVDREQRAIKAIDDKLAAADAQRRERLADIIDPHKIVDDGAFTHILVAQVAADIAYAAICDFRDYVRKHGVTWNTLDQLAGDAEKAIGKFACFATHSDNQALNNLVLDDDALIDRVYRLIGAYVETKMANNPDRSNPNETLYAARDDDQKLHLFHGKPQRVGSKWVSAKDGRRYALHQSLLPTVRCDDDQPRRLELNDLAEL
ncbi:MAG: hypothetical protein HUK01_08140 [Bacteroidaceae bacterium]|nr:hypothetical protein [Bacteroidaceae bacterium]